MPLLSNFTARIASAWRSFSNPSPAVMEAFGATPSRAGVTVNERTAMSASAVFGCVRNLGEDLAKLPFIVYRTLSPRGKERLPAHPVYRLLQNAPNSEQTAFEVRQCLTAMAVLYGNGRAEIERNGGGVPIALWPILPRRIRPLRDPTGTLYYQVDGKTRLEQSDVFDLRGFSITGIVGEMVTQVGRDSFGLTLAADRFAATFFGQGTRTTGIIEHPGKFTGKAYENLRRTWDEQYKGIDNAHKTPILEEGAKYSKTTTDPEEAQMLESRQFQVEDVCRWFRMPPHKVGHLERAQGWSTLETANTDYVVDTLMPWFERWEQEAKRKLIKASETEIFAEHLAAGMLRGDTAARYLAYNQALMSGWMCLDEVRELENLNPIPNGQGEIFRVPMNLKRIDLMNANPPPPSSPPALPAPAPSPDPEKKPEPEKVAVNRAMRSLAADAVRRVLRTEADKVRRAAAKPNFTAWVETFYGAHADYVRDAMNPVCRAFDRPDFDAASYAAAHRRDLLLAASAIPAGGKLSEAIEHVLGRWELEKPSAIAGQLAGEK